MSDPYKRDRRLGRWKVSQRELVEYPGRVEAIQRHVTILKASPAWEYDGTDFLGRCPSFEIVEEGDEIPLYVPTITREGVSWVRA